MAMNKKEQAAFNQMKVDLEHARALSWPSQPCPQPMTTEKILSLRGSDSFGTVVQGWFVNSYANRIYRGCSNGYNHSQRSTTKTDQQGCGEIYRTFEEAKLALHWKVALLSAGNLARVLSLKESTCEF